MEKYPFFLFWPNLGTGRPSTPSLFPLPACSARPAGGPAALLPHQPTTARPGLAPRPAAPAPVCSFFLSLRPGPIRQRTPALARASHRPLCSACPQHRWPRASDSRTRCSFPLSLRRGTRVSRPPARAVRSPAAPLAHPSAGPAHFPFLPRRARSLSFLSPADGAAKHGKPPPPSLPQGRRSNPARASSPFPSTPQPPIYKAEPSPIFSRSRPRSSPFATATGELPLPSANAIADPSRSSATTRRSRSFLPFSISDSFCSVFTSPAPPSLSSRHCRRRLASEASRTPQPPPSASR